MQKVGQKAAKVSLIQIYFHKSFSPLPSLAIPSPIPFSTPPQDHGCSADKRFTVRPYHLKELKGVKSSF